MGIGNDENEGFNSGAANNRNEFHQYIRLLRQWQHFQRHDRRMRAFYLAHPPNWQRWWWGVPDVKENLFNLPVIDLIQQVMMVKYSPN